MKTAEYIYNFLIAQFNNKYGVCALMGNLYAESGLIANNLQNSGNRFLNMTDEEYTTAVDNGTYNNFVYDAQGYGLAQWTYWSRKQNLLNYARSKGKSIGDLDIQLFFLVNELKAYRTVYNAIINATSVKECSDIIVTQYERPANQSRENLDRRANWGLKYLQDFSVSAPTTTEKGFITYKVKRGDTLWGIATRYYGNGTKYPQIMKDNNLTTTVIEINQLLKIREV